MDIDNLVDGLFCINCESIDIINNEIKCSKSNCNCSMNSSFNSLLDLFSNICYLIDNTNYVNFHDELKKINHRDLLHQTLEIKQKWDTHISIKPYSSNEFKFIHTETIFLLKEDLKNQLDKQSLLIRIVLWIRQIDNHLDVLFNYLERKIIQDAYFNTKRGILLLRLKSKIADYLFDIRKRKPFINPNNFKLNFELKSVYLAKERYNYYPNIRHKNMNFGISEDFINNKIQDLKIGFLSGDFSVDDYDWCIEENNHESKYFYFKGVNKKENYCEYVENNLKKLLASNPHFIILPELFTPVDLQEKIQKQIEDYYEQKTINEEEINLLMVLPGSFHFEDQTGIYNVSRVINSSGDMVEKIYKNNQFTIYQNENYSGPLEPFKMHNGLEKISLSRRDITIFDTSLGRIAVLICIDFIIDEVANVLEDRLVDIIFVMAMTPNPDGGKFERRFKELAEKNKAVVIIGNNSKESTKNLINLPGINKPYIANKPSEVRAIVELFN